MSLYLSLSSLGKRFIVASFLICISFSRGNVFDCVHFPQDSALSIFVNGASVFSAECTIGMVLGLVLLRQYGNEAISCKL